jgi:hypothetical protein
MDMSRTSAEFGSDAAALDAGAPEARSGFGRKFRRVLLVLALSLVAVAVVLQLMWTFSGTNQWELFAEHPDVKVYAMKSPGYNNLKFKGVTRLHVKMSAIAAALQDDEMAKAAHFTHLQMITGSDPQHFVAVSQSELPLFFRPREYIEEVDLTQHHGTKEVVLTVTGAPDKLPPNDCCVRVTRMNDEWRFIPVANGDVELQLTINADLGGFVPYFFYNVGTAQFLLDVLPLVQQIVSEDKYQHTKFDFIEDVGPDGK